MPIKQLSDSELHSKALFSSFFGFVTKANWDKLNRSPNSAKIKQALSYLYSRDFFDKKNNPLNSRYAQFIFDTLCNTDDPINYAKGVAYICEKSKPKSSLRLLWDRLMNSLGFENQASGFEDVIGLDNQTEVITAYGVIVDYKVHVDKDGSDPDQYFSVLRNHANPRAAASAMVFLSSNELLVQNQEKQLNSVARSSEPMNTANVLVSLNRRNCLQGGDDFDKLSDCMYQLAEDVNDQDAKLIEEALKILKLYYKLHEVYASGTLLIILKSIIQHAQKDKLIQENKLGNSGMLSELIKQLCLDNLPVASEKSLKVSNASASEQTVEPNKASIFRESREGDSPRTVTDPSLEDAPKHTFK